MKPACVVEDSETSRACPQTHLTPPDSLPPPAHSGLARPVLSLRLAIGCSRQQHLLRPACASARRHEGWRGWRVSESLKLNRGFNRVSLGSLKLNRASECVAPVAVRVRGTDPKRRRVAAVQLVRLVRHRRRRCWLQLGRLPRGLCRRLRRRHRRAVAVRVGGACLRGQRGRGGVRVLWRPPLSGGFGPIAHG